MEKFLPRDRLHSLRTRHRLVCIQVRRFTPLGLNHLEYDMSTASKDTANRQETPENYRKPGNANLAATLAPSACEVLSILNGIEAKIAA